MITFRPSQKEYEAARAFMKKHDMEKHGATEYIYPETGEVVTLRNAGAIGGGWTWHFTSTSLGDAVSVYCSCGEHLNVTDYESW